MLFLLLCLVFLLKFWRSKMKSFLVSYTSCLHRYHIVGFLEPKIVETLILSVCKSILNFFTHFINCKKVKLAKDLFVHILARTNQTVEIFLNMSYNKVLLFYFKNCPRNIISYSKVLILLKFFTSQVARFALNFRRCQLWKKISKNGNNN